MPVAELEQGLRRVGDGVQAYCDQVEGGAEITYTVLNFAELFGEIDGRRRGRLNGAHHPHAPLEIGRPERAPRLIDELEGADRSLHGHLWGERLTNDARNGPRECDEDEERPERAAPEEVCHPALERIAARRRRRCIRDAPAGFRKVRRGYGHRAGLADKSGRSKRREAHNFRAARACSRSKKRGTNQEKTLAVRKLAY
jgi:hypothetical protein